MLRTQNLDTDSAPTYLSHYALPQSGPVSESHRFFPCPVIFLGEKADYLTRGSSRHSQCVQLRACGGEGLGGARDGASATMALSEAALGVGRGALWSLRPCRCPGRILAASLRVCGGGTLEAGGGDEQSGRTFRFLPD